MAATGLNHVSISASDIDESLRFYEEFLGLERVPAPNFGHRVEWLRAGDLQLHLFARDITPTPYHHIAFTVDNFQELYVDARARGILIEIPGFATVTELPDGGAQMYLRDPGGNLVELDTPDASVLDRDVVSLRRLTDDFEHDAWQRRATLFLAARGDGA